MDWEIQETNTHQDHVIAHVIGATVLGYFTADETACLLLDIGFIWTIYLDGEMGLVPQAMAIAELEIDDETKAQLRDDAQILHTAAGAQSSLKRMIRAPDVSLIMEVNFYAHAQERRLLLTCEEANLAIETSLASGEIQFHLI